MLILGAGTWSLSMGPFTGGAPFYKQKAGVNVKGPYNLPWAYQGSWALGGFGFRAQGPGSGFGVLGAIGLPAAGILTITPSSACKETADRPHHMSHDDEKKADEHACARPGVVWAYYSKVKLLGP